MSDTLRELVESFGYAGILLAFFIEHVFPPIPGQIVIPVAGVMIVRGDMAFVPAWLSGALGGTLGSLALYQVGRWADAERITGYVKRVGLSEDNIRRARDSFMRYGRLMVLFWHLTPVSPLRVGVSLLAGAERMPRLQFLAYCGLANLIWVGAQLYAVVLLGDNTEVILLSLLNTPRGFWVGLIVAILVGGGVWWRWKRRRTPPAD